MSLKIVTAPTAEPIEVAEAKSHLYVMDEEQDEYILSLITAARAWCESFTRQSLMTTTWQQTLQGWPSCGVIELDRPPLASVTSVQYVDENGTTQTLSSGNYVVDTASKPGRILRGYGVTWPSLRYEGVAAPVTIEFVAGYASASLVPAQFKHAIKLVVGHWFEHREDVTSGAMSQVPLAARALLASAAHGSYP